MEQPDLWDRRVNEKFEYVIASGRLSHALTEQVAPSAGVRATGGQHNEVLAVVEAGAVKLRWFTFGRNWASLLFAREWIQSFRGPYTLNYYVAGWFTETYCDMLDACDRLTELICKSDVHLSSTVYIQDGDHSRADIPKLLKSALAKNSADEETSVDCIYDPLSGKYKVNRVGKESSIGRNYGLSPISYPCLTGHSYDQVVSRAYPQVQRSGQPHYDHIYAAFAAPTGDVLWVPYQRVVLPLGGRRGKNGVRVVTEMTKVDISPL